LLSIVEKSGFELCNVICTPLWELELYDMGPEPGIYNRELACISDIVIEKYMKKDPKF
jgi:hypothetical protein